MCCGFLLFWGSEVRESSCFSSTCRSLLLDTSWFDPLMLLLIRAWHLSKSNTDTSFRTNTKTVLISFPVARSCSAHCGCSFSVQSSIILAYPNLICCQKNAGNIIVMPFFFFFCRQIKAIPCSTGSILFNVKQLQWTVSMGAYVK